VNESDALKCVVNIQERETNKCLIALASHRAMSPLRQALPRHSASRQVGTPQLTLGALELQKTNTEKSLSLPPFVFMSPMRQQGGFFWHFHAIPHRAGLAPPNSRWGLLNCRIRTQKNHYLCNHLSS
jgi:hypothetical protein